MSEPYPEPPAFDTLNDENYDVTMVEYRKKLENWYKSNEPAEPERPYIPADPDDYTGPVGGSRRSKKSKRTKRKKTRRR